MTKNLSLLIACLILLLSNVNNVSAQIYDPEKGCLVDAPGEPCLPNTLLSATPFLRINPDARAGGMGDAGLATSADANSLHFNASKLAFVDNDFSISATYTPWLRQLGLQDVYLAYLAGYKQINELQSLGFGLRFFSLGDIAFTDNEGNPAGNGKPREFEFSVAYARKLAENFSASFTAKYIYSNLASGQQLSTDVVITPGTAAAADIALSYILPLNVGDYGTDLSFGMAVTNLGTKVTYTNDLTRDFLPANLGIGAAWKIDIDQYNTFTIAADFNKLLIPTPVPFQDTERYDVQPANGIPDYKERSMFGAAVNSFSDAAGGLSEELLEIYYSTGVEYWYDQQFAVRAGYYYESPRKGDRQFLTVGLGLRYNVYSMDISYLVPTNNRKGPLDNTLRFSMNYVLGDIAGQ